MSPESAGDMIKRAASVLREAGVPNPVHDARRLLGAALQETKHSPVPIDFRLISDDEKMRFDAFVVRRANREPLQHITQSASIFELQIKSDARALIPRDDSAELLTLAMIQLAERESDPFVIADLGTGTGVLLAECLNHFPRATGIAVESNADALGLASENFQSLGQKDRITLFRGSWAEWTGWTECDLIISNPPYIRSDEITTLAPEVRDHDPTEALDGGADGLDAYREIISLGGQHMRQGAHLVLEIGYDQKASVTDLLETAGFSNLQHRQDLSGHDRAIAARKT